MKSVSQLRSEGFKVRVCHSRRVKLGRRFGYIPNKDITPESAYLATGGMTHVDVTSPDGRTASAEATCHSDESFCKKIGLNVALGRALKQLEV